MWLVQSKQRAQKVKKFFSSLVVVFCFCCYCYCSIQAKGVEGKTSFSPLLLLFLCCYCYCRCFFQSKSTASCEPVFTLCRHSWRWLLPNTFLSFLFAKLSMIHLFWWTFRSCRLSLWFAGGASSEHPSILYQFDFGSLTNSSLRQIERELTEVSFLALTIMSTSP